VSLIFSQGVISRALSVAKTSGPVVGCIRATTAIVMQRLDQQGSFEAIGLQENVYEPAPRGDYSNLEEPTIFYLGA
jgi:hypothetical protein